MTIWAVYNGWQGNGAVAALVAADTEAEAIELARARFAEVAERETRFAPNADPSTYYERLKAERLELPALVELS